MKIGLFGGTFNPIHTGHLILAETARETFGLDRVLFIPANLPPHKVTRDLAPGLLRLKLIQLAIRDHAAFAASDIELHRSGVSYTIETVRALRKQLPDATLFLIIGEDMLAVRWLAWDALKRACTIVVAHRSGKPARRSLGVGGKAIRRETGLKWLEMPRLDISSSDVRSRIGSGRSIRYLTPAAVERYIRQHRLYR